MRRAAGGLPSASAAFWNWMPATTRLTGCSVSQSSSGPNGPGNGPLYGGVPQKLSIKADSDWLITRTGCSVSPLTMMMPARAEPVEMLGDQGAGGPDSHSQGSGRGPHSPPSCRMSSRRQQLPGRQWLRVEQRPIHAADDRAAEADGVRIVRVGQMVEQFHERGCLDGDFAHFGCLSWRWVLLREGRFVAQVRRDHVAPCGGGHRPTAGDRAGWSVRSSSAAASLCKPRLPLFSSLNTPSCE